MHMSADKTRLPSFGASLATVAGVVVIIAGGIVLLKAEMHALLFLAIIFASAVAYAVGRNTGELLDGVRSTIDRATPALMIFILIGTIVASWMQAGTIPALIYYGLGMTNAQLFLPAGLLLTSAMSLATGTSWGTVATAGIALMGIGAGLGLPPGVVAGMIVSGAVFGDKLSPVSDTTNLAAASAETDLRSHIVAMLYTTAPAYLISFVLFTALSLHLASGATVDHAQIDLIQGTLDERFNLNPLVLAPMVLLLVLMILKVDAIPAMVLATLAGMIFSLGVQGTSFVEALVALSEGYTEETGVEIVDVIILRGGIQSMMWTFSLAFLALCLGGVLEKAGFLTVLVERAIAATRSAANLVTLTIGSTFATNALMGENYMSIILNGAMYRQAFDKAGLQRRMLSRTLEEGGTQTAGLIPWSTTGAFFAGSLGVATTSYLPYAFLNYLNPLLSIGLAYLGIFVLRAGAQAVRPPEPSS